MAILAAVNNPSARLVFCPHPSLPDSPSPYSRLGQNEMIMIRGKRFYSTKVFWGALVLLAIAAVGLMHFQGGVIDFFTQIAAADGTSPTRRPSPVQDEPSAEPQGTIGQQIRQLEHSAGLPQDQILQKYQNFIYSLVTEQNLKQLEKDNPFRRAAKEQTVAVLSWLDSPHRGKLLEFLIESNLIVGDEPTLSLHGADLSGVDFSNKSLSQINLRGVNLSDAQLSQADLSGTKLFGATIDRANLRFARLSQAELFRASLQQANLFLANLSGATLQEANLAGADLFLADLRNANLNKTNLSNADLSFANLSKAQLVFANLQSANFYQANLRESSLSGADLQGAVLQGADLRQTDLSGANLRNANLSGADLTGANLTGTDLTDAILFRTILPNG
jgi:uncharacterized protein YjbI with pentapeptide repeats